MRERGELRRLLGFRPEELEWHWVSFSSTFSSPLGFLSSLSEVSPCVGPSTVGFFRLHPWLLQSLLLIDTIFPVLKLNILNVLFGSLLQALALADAEGGRHGSRTTLND